jgi:peptidyl-prolyl cis-trans isomerase D
MAIIQSIRNRAGLLLAVVIGVALLAFILGDFITSGGFFVDRSRMAVAEINGKKIQYPYYQQNLIQIENVLKTQYGVTSLNAEMAENARNQAWQDLIQEFLLDKEYTKLGLAISDAELSDLIQGPNPHPFIMQMFANRETGTLDRLQLSEFMSRLEDITGNEKRIWVYYENLINTERLFTKYHNLVRKGLYVNSLQAQRRQKEMNTSADLSFIVKPYSTIADSTITIGKKELKKYYNTYKEKYKQEESRNIKYVAFNIKPSEKDFRTAELWVTDKFDEFREVKDIEQYIRFNSPPYDPTNYSQGDLPDSLDRFLFNAEPGEIYGPYFEDNAYKLAKLARINYLPDSVRVSHILLPANQQNVNQIRSLADSLVKLGNEGYSFETLVEQNSRDMQSFLQKGDLGWIKEGTKGQAFSDSCFYAQQGEVKLTFSQEGFHIVKITDRSRPVKKVQVGILSREVVPGNETDQLYYSKAVDFLNNNRTLEQFEASTKNNDPMAVPVYGLKPLDREVSGLENSRTLVQWAFEEAEEGEILRTIEKFDDNYVIAALVKKNKAGYIPFDDVSSTIELELRKQKKAEMLIAEMKPLMENAQSIDAVASSLNLPVKSASDIRFTSFQIRDAGSEPKLIAAAAISVEPEILQGPLAGENGVYIYLVDNRVTNENPDNDLDLAQNAIERTYAARANRSTFETLQDIANIKDNRGRFF